jgi:hypothetical protein
MAPTLVSNSLEDGDYMPDDFILSADFGFGCAALAFNLLFNTLAKAEIMGLFKR